MSKHDKLLDKLLRGTSDANLLFEGLCHLLRRLGFASRVKGSHHIFSRDGVEEILNCSRAARMRNRIRQNKCAT